MGKKGKKAQAGKPKKLTPKDIGKRLDVLAKKVEEELKGADLFAPLPPTEDCAICFVPLSPVKCQSFYQACCGNSICLACHMENKESINKQNEVKNAGKKLALTCPFCREPKPTTGLGFMRQLQSRCLQNDPTAFTMMGVVHQNGEHCQPKNELKALDYWIQAVELGSFEACNCIASFYHEGNGLSANTERDTLFAKVSALRGSIAARHNVGLSEYYDLGNYEIAIRHWKIAAEAGSQCSLNELRDIFNAFGKKPGKKFISEEYLDFVLLACHKAQLEVKSEEREKHSGGNPIIPFTR